MDTIIDLEPNVIDDVKNSKMVAMFHPEILWHGKEDAASNFARGHYTVGKEIIDKVNDRLLKLVGNCDNVQGFVITHSGRGGTGSGLGALILERVAVDYEKKSKLGFEVYQSPTISTAVIEPYNAMFAIHSLLDHIEVSLLIDNEAVNEIRQTKLGIKTPSYENSNRLISKVISPMTASLRFEGELKVDLNEFQTNLVPFPRLYFMTTSMAPVITPSKADRKKMMFNSILKKIISLNYRVNVQRKDANACVQWLRGKKKVYVVEWCPTGFKLCLNAVPPAVVCRY